MWPVCARATDVRTAVAIYVFSYYKLAMTCVGVLNCVTITGKYIVARAPGVDCSSPEFAVLYPVCPPFAHRSIDA